MSAFKKYALPWLAILFILGVTAFFSSQIPKITMDNEITTFLPESDPAKQYYNDVEETFGSQILAVIGIFVDEGSGVDDVFNPGVLTMIRDMSDTLEKSSLHAQIDIRKKVKQADGTRLWQLVETKEGELSPKDVISIATISHVFSQEKPPEKEGDEVEREIKVLEVLPELGSDAGARLELAKSKNLPFRKLPPELLYSKDTADKARHALSDWELYKKNIVSEDLKSTAIYVTIPRGGNIEYETRLQEFIEELVAKYEHPDDGISFQISGLPMAAVMLGQYMQRDLATLVPICFGVMVFVLLISFRRVNGVLMPFLTVALSVIWTVGLMAYLGIAMTVITNGLPVLLVAVGSAYTIHVIHHFYERQAMGVPKFEAISTTMRKIGVAVLMAGLTTVGGFGSLVSSNVIPIKEFGMFAAFGAFSALMINFILVPAVLAVFPYKQVKQQNGNGRLDELEVAEKSALGGLLRGIASFVAKRPKTVAVASLLVFASFMAISSQVVVDSNMVLFFKKHSPIRIADKALNKMLGGTTTFSIVLDSKEEEGFLYPENLKKVDALQGYLHQQFPVRIQKTMSFADYIKKMNKTVMNELESDYKIPDSIASVAENLSFYENKPETIEGVIDFDRGKTRILVRSTVGGTKYMTEYKRVIEQYIAENLPKEWDVQISGEMYLRWVTDQQISQGQIRSIILSIIAVSILLLIIFRSIKLALICLVPILISISGNFAMMAIFRIPLDVGTALIASTAVGIGIDYGIHYVNRFRIESRASGDLAEAIRRTNVTSGKAILFNCIAVALGFTVLTGSQFIPLIRMGALSAAVMVFAAFSTLTTLPALLMVFRPYDKKAGQGKAGAA